MLITHKELNDFLWLDTAFKEKINLFKKQVKACMTNSRLNDHNLDVFLNRIENGIKERLCVALPDDSVDNLTETIKVASQDMLVDFIIFAAR